MALKVELKPGERVIIGDCVVTNTHQRTRLVIEGETPILGTFVKQRCRKVADGDEVIVEIRHYYKPGQALLDPNTGLPTINQFESSARLQVVRLDTLQK